MILLPEASKAADSPDPLTLPAEAVQVMLKLSLSHSVALALISTARPEATSAIGVWQPVLPVLSYRKKYRILSPKCK